MSTPSFNLRGYADAKPSEAIQPHQLPGLAVAVVFPGKPGEVLLELPIRQFKDYKSNAKGNAARRLAKWLRDQSSEGLQLTGFFQVADQRDVAICGLSRLEELPRTYVERHYDSYRLYFESDHIDFAQAVALEYYEFTINIGVLRAGLRIPTSYSIDILHRNRSHQEGLNSMAKPNYQFEKRQRELEKKKKKAEKVQKKASAADEPAQPMAAPPAADPPPL